VKAEHPHAVVEVWGEDEARLGLKPIVRRVWAIKGHRPQLVQRRGYKWLYLYGFIEPLTGRVVWLVLPALNRRAFEAALREFAEQVGAGPDKHIVLVLDGAGAHKNLEVPDGIHLVYQPAYSPELQPAERLWPLVREALANRLFETLDAVEDALIARCSALLEWPELLSSYTAFHWWREAVGAAE
jgi:transposase